MEPSASYCITIIETFSDPKLRTEPPPGQKCAGSAYRGGTRAGGGKRCCTPSVIIIHNSGPGLRVPFLSGPLR